MRRLLVAIVSASALSVCGAPAAADPPACADPCYLHITVPVTIHSDDGDELRLPPGFFRDEPSHERWESELERLQETETRLSAENESLRESAREWRPSWHTLVGALALGIAGGFAIAVAL